MWIPNCRRIAFLAQCLFLFFPFLFSTTSAGSVYDSYDPYYNDTLVPRQSKVALRIMPLGASITQGAASVPLNGYRKGLRDQLRFLGYEVNMVGSGSDGAFNDNQHEGHPGALIRELLDPRPEKYLDELQVGMKYKPNVVLILVGSNDCVQGHIANDKTFQNARILEMETLINWVYDNSAGVTVILATLPPTGPSSQFPDLNSYVFLLNNEYRKLVLRYKSNGKRIELADMNTGFFQQPADGTPGDVLHPNNQGYAKLAAVFAKAMQSVESSIQTPTNTGIPDKGTGVCPPNANSFSGPVQTQRGSGVEDGSYRHAETAMGTLVKNTLTLPTFGTHDKQFMFAQLVSNVNIGRGGEADDMILALDFEQQSYLRGLGFGILNYKLNGHWDEDWIALTTNAYCNPIWLRWGDFNNDGLDDWICLEDNGDMTVQINLGGSPPKFSGPNVVRNNKGTAQSAIRLGDIDGDGRLDYCYIAANQDIYCFRNGGQGNGVDYWQEMGGGGPTFNGKAWPETNGIRLVDINGDFRADVVYVFGDGATAIWINQRGTAADGPGLKPAWIAAASSHGPTGLGRDQVKFARIYASGRADYIKAVTKETEVRPLPSVSVYESTWSVVRNDGCCGKNLRGDGVHYCDMYGRGHDDYIWIWSDGKITVYENINNPPFWDPHEFVLDVATPRKHVHFADWNGDGKCDVLTVDQISGQVSVWLNTYNGVGNVPTFAGKAVAVAAPACSQRDGVGLFDQAARFADVDGDGRADFLCLELSGRTTGWLSKPTGAQSIGQVKLGVGLDRANLQYVDLNGDRRADLVWQDKITGDVQIFNNQGMIPSSGSAFQWGPPTAGLWKKGMDRGANLYFAKMSNSGKVDYVQNLPKTNIAYVWYNQCPGGGSLDDGPIVDPHLPVVPDNPPSVICPRAVQCGKFPNKPHFISMGDSYAAGIGAGPHLSTSWSTSKYDNKGICFLGQNSYAMQLQASTPELQSPKFLDWTACTGAKMKDIYLYDPAQDPAQRGKWQFDYLAEIAKGDYSIIMMSMGGNDVDFGGIATWCLVLPPRTPSTADNLFEGGSCGRKIDGAQRAVRSGKYQGQITQENDDLKRRLLGMYRKVLEQPEDDDTMLIITGYARFFNQDDQTSTPDQDCGKKTLSAFQNIAFVTFQKFIHKGYLTAEFRRTINEAVLAMNQIIQDTIALINYYFEQQGSSRRAFYVDIDAGVEGHRFCDKRNGKLLDFSTEGFMHLIQTPDIIANSDGIPNVQPREDPTAPDPAGTLLQGGPQPGDCENEDDIFASWRCWVYSSDMTYNDVNVDLYPGLGPVTGSRKRQVDPSEEAETLTATELEKREFTFPDPVEAMKQWVKALEQMTKYSGMKAFHPKTVVHTATMNKIKSQLAGWQKNRPCGCEP